MNIYFGFLMNDLSDIFSDLPKLIENNTFKLLNNVYKEYSFYNFTRNFILNQKIIDNICKSEFILIKYHSGENRIDDIFIISIKNSIIIIVKKLLSNLQTLFSNNIKVPIYFFARTRLIFNSITTIENPQLEFSSNFLEEIRNFHSNFNINPYLKTYLTI